MQSKSYQINYYRGHKMSKAEVSALNQYYLFGFWKNRGSMKVADRRQLLINLQSLGYLDNSGITNAGTQYCINNRGV